MSDNDLTPYAGHDIALPSDGGVPAVPDYGQVPATVRDGYMPSPYGGSDHHAPAPYQPGPGATSGHKAFGVPIPAGVSVERMNAEFAVIADVFRNDMAKLNIPATFATPAARWFQSAAMQPPPNEAPQHPYRVNLSAFSATDQRYATQFLNLMARLDAPQSVVDRMIGWYFKLLDRLGATNVPTTKRTHITDADIDVIEARCQQDARDCESALRELWGHSFDSNIAVVARHVAGLRQELRDHLQNACYSDGRLCLNDERVILHLWGEANGGTPSNVEDEISQIENVMRTDNRRYVRDEALQRRLRHLYALRGH